MGVKITENTKLRRLALPMFIEMLFNALLNNVDTIMLSGYSENAVGSVGNANLVLNLTNVLFQIIGVATSVVVSQYMGAERHKEINKVYSVAFIVNVSFGFILSVILFGGANIIMTLIGVPEVMFRDSVRYMRIVGGTMFFQAGFNVMVAIMRCNGLQKIGMYSAFTVNVINVIGNYSFLYGIWAKYDLGAAGAAIATAVARIVAVSILLTVFFVKRIGRISVRYLKPFPTAIFKTMLRIGLPSAGENISYTMYQMFLLSLVNLMDVNSINARIYCSTLMSFSVIFAFSVSNACQILVGYLVGAGKEDQADRRVKKYLKMCLPISVGIATMNWALSPLTLRLFTKSAEVIALGRKVLIVCIVLEIGRTMNLLVIAAMKAAGDVKFPFYLGLCTMWGIGLGFGALCGLGFKWGVAGIFMGIAGDEFVRGIVVTIRWYKGKWRGKAIARKA